MTRDLGHDPPETACGGAGLGAGGCCGCCSCDDWLPCPDWLPTVLPACPALPPCPALPACLDVLEADVRLVAGAPWPGSAWAKAVPSPRVAAAAPPAIHTDTRRVRPSMASRRAAARSAGHGMACMSFLARWEFFVAVSCEPAPPEWPAAEFPRSLACPVTCTGSVQETFRTGKHGSDLRMKKGGEFALRLTPSP